MIAGLEVSEVDYRRSGSLLVQALGHVTIDLGGFNLKHKGVMVSSQLIHIILLAFCNTLWVLLSFVSKLYPFYPYLCVFFFFK